MDRENAIRWLVTAGPTCEDIDPVRFISNRSTGTMGYAVAEAAALRGDTVELVSGPVALTPPDGCRLTSVRSARQMYDAVLALFEVSDIVVMAAAVADFRPRAPSREKIKKSSSVMTLELEQTEDILAELGRRKGSRTLIGFALESPGEDRTPGSGITARMRASAQTKLSSKNLDAIVLNGPAAIGAQESDIALLHADGRWEEAGTASKSDHAKLIVTTAARMALR
jgi:phosphopantothenoylcysteine decarboxylase/phosphopantothenate--cysteine ligase